MPEGGREGGRKGGREEGKEGEGGRERGREGGREGRRKFHRADPNTVMHSEQQLLILLIPTHPLQVNELLQYTLPLHPCSSDNAPYKHATSLICTH